MSAADPSGGASANVFEDQFTNVTPDQHRSSNAIQPSGSVYENILLLLTLSDDKALLSEDILMSVSYQEGI
jgi:hypothetical protein